MKPRLNSFFIAPFLILVIFSSNVLADDWPMWRYDAARTAASPQQLPSRLHLQWTRQYRPLKQAWEEAINQDRMPYDRVYEPVVMGKLMFIGFNDSDKVVALDTDTGQEVWRFYTDGPVRLPAVCYKKKGRFGIEKQRVLFTSDDGNLYCLDAKKGKLIWKFQGCPSNYKVLGNGRFISAWPGREGPVIKDNIVYFSSGIWPFMGVFIYAIDVETGKVLWENSGQSSRYMQQPHGGADSFAGVGPQGAFAIAADKLIVPGGRSVPAVLDIRNGRLLYYHMRSRKREGGSHVCATDEFFFNHRESNTASYDLETGKMLTMYKGTTYPVLSENTCYLSGQTTRAYSMDRLKDKKLGQLWECKADSTGALIKTGKQLYAGGENKISAIDFKSKDTPEIGWTADIDGKVARLIAAEDKLFAVTLQGRIYAFGGQKKRSKIHNLTPGNITSDSKIAAEAKKILKATKVDKGYCLVYGVETGRLAEELVRNSDLNVIAVGPDAKKVETLRRRWDEAGLYGGRISVHKGNPMSFGAPPYLTVLTVFEDLKAAGFEERQEFVKKVFYSLRPYGGVAYLPIEDKQQQDSFEEIIAKSGLTGAKVVKSSKCVLLSREGPLPGAGQWTHQYGDIANTTKSDDKLVKLPLGLLWFGGNSHKDILPRHSHGPPEQIVGGRLFIEGINSLTARDVYTGAVLWKRKFDNLGTFGVYYDQSYNPGSNYNQAHHPGANARGTNYVVTRDKIYLIVEKDCFVLDPATGKTNTKFSISDGGNNKAKFSYIGVYKDLLIAGANFVSFSKKYNITLDKKLSSRKKAFQNYDNTSSAGLVVMDRYTGKVLWRKKAEFAFRNNAICAGGGKVYCIDNIPHGIREKLKRRGEDPNIQPKLKAYDIKTGEHLWSKDENIFGTWLSYSNEHDILIQAGRNSSDNLPDEPTHRITAYRGIDGQVLWDKETYHGGPVMIHNKRLYLNSSNYKSYDVMALELLTGEPVMRSHPLTEEVTPWNYLRLKGCGSSIASENLLTFRSGAAAYFDLANDGGTGNFGGFKSGCTENLIAADGILNAPDYTRTCTCSYQNQTSLALVHMPGVELWTFNHLDYDGKSRIKQLGLNFGAPGDRRAENGTLWLDYPSVGGESPKVQVNLGPIGAIIKDDEKKTAFTGSFLRYHSSKIKEGDLKWVAASGVTGASSVTITLAEGAANTRKYTVNLVFAELEDVNNGQRVFDVLLQGKKVLENFDIVKEAGGRNKTVIKEFKNIAVKDALKIELKKTAGKNQKPPILCGIEMIAEDWYPYKQKKFPIAVYSTGVDDNNKLLPDGAVDLHWRLVHGNDKTGKDQKTYTIQSAKAPIPPWSKQTADSKSKWITLRADGVDIPSGTYVYEQTFNLNQRIDLHTASVFGRFTGDDAVDSININGIKIAEGAGFAHWTNFLITEHLVAGENTLKVTVKNTGKKPNPHGLRIELTGWADGK